MHCGGDIRSNTAVVLSVRACVCVCMSHFDLVNMIETKSSCATSSNMVDMLTTIT